MSVSISEIGNLQASEPVDLDIYKTINRARPTGLPPRGEYEVRVPDSFSKENFGATQAGLLKVTFNVAIAAGDRTGFPIRVRNMSAKVWTDKQGHQQSGIGEYLASMGYQGTLPTDPQRLVDLICATAGRTVTAYCDWVAEHYASQYKVTGMRNFPTGADGQPQSFVPHPTEKDAEGNALRLRANLEIRKWLVPSDSIN